MHLNATSGADSVPSLHCKFNLRGNDPIFLLFEFIDYILEFDKKYDAYLIR